MAKAKPEIVAKNISKMTDKQLKIAEKKICKVINPREYKYRYTIAGRKKYITMVSKKYGKFKAMVVADVYNRNYGKLY